MRFMIPSEEVNDTENDHSRNDRADQGFEPLYGELPEVIHRAASHPVHEHPDSHPR
jgi:hypothetical protein